MQLNEWINSQHIKNANLLKSAFSKSKPFKNIEINDFFIIDKLVPVVKALVSEKFIEKESDLFKFMQTQDLKGSKNKILSDFRKFLCSPEFVSFIHNITGFNLKEGIVDSAGTLYRDADYLLCHDDQLEGRKIAFMIYLSDLSLSEGGSLDLLDKSYKTAARINPKFNKFAFFEVSPISFHEVSEVLVDKQRLAIGGWLHGN